MVSISPGYAPLVVGNALQFSAQVTGPTNTAVAWQVTGIDGGNAPALPKTAGSRATTLHAVRGVAPSEFDLSKPSKFRILSAGQNCAVVILSWVYSAGFLLC
jgi:hypothetical protein